MCSLVRLVAALVNCPQHRKTRGRTRQICSILPRNRWRRQNFPPSAAAECVRRAAGKVVAPRLILHELREETLALRKAKLGPDHRDTLGSIRSGTREPLAIDAPNEFVFQV